MKVGDLISYKDFYSIDHYGIVVEKCSGGLAHLGTAYYVLSKGATKVVRESNGKVISESR